MVGGLVDDLPFGHLVNGAIIKINNQVVVGYGTTFSVDLMYKTNTKSDTE